MLSYGGLKSQDLEILGAIFAFFWKNDPPVFTSSPIDVIVFKCRKICLTENRWNRALFTWQKEKKQNFSCLSNCRYCADRAWNLPRPARNIVLTLLLISSKSVHCRRSYSLTREHRFFVQQSISTLRLKLADAYLRANNKQSCTVPVHYDILSKLLIFARRCNAAWRCYTTEADRSADTMQLQRPDQCNYYCKQVVKELCREAASQGGGWFFTGEKLMWHRPVRSKAVGCRAVAVMPLLIFAAYTAAVTDDVFNGPDNPNNCPVGICTAI